MTDKKRACDCYLNALCMYTSLLSDSGIELVMEELVEVTVLREDPGPPLPHSDLIAVVCATQADGSIGRTGSCRGTVK